jgi:hypothetical protein
MAKQVKKILKVEVDGAINTRKTAKEYTHVVIGRADVDAHQKRIDEGPTADEMALYRRNAEFNVARTTDEWKKAQLEKWNWLTEEQADADQQKAIEELAGRGVEELVANYIEMYYEGARHQLAQAIERAKRRSVISWHTRHDLAIKAAEKCTWLTDVSVIEIPAQ